MWPLKKIPVLASRTEFFLWTEFEQSSFDSVVLCTEYNRLCSELHVLWKWSNWNLIARGTREYSCFWLEPQCEQKAKIIVIFVAGHFTFLNPQTNDNTENLLLQFLEKLAPEKLPLPWPDALREMSMNLSRPSADASKHMTKKFDLLVAATTYCPPWRRLFSRSVPAAVVAPLTLVLLDVCPIWVDCWFGHQPLHFLWHWLCSSCTWHGLK